MLCDSRCTTGCNILGFCEEELMAVTHKFHPDKKEVTLVSYAPRKYRYAVIIIYVALPTCCQ
jgi:hypothetical protein